MARKKKVVYKPGDVVAVQKGYVLLLVVPVDKTRKLGNIILKDRAGDTLMQQGVLEDEALLTFLEEHNAKVLFNMSPIALTLTL
jgi:hypothetical protein